MNDAWIIDACRTPRGIGKFGKVTLSEIHPQQLAATVLKALAGRNGIRTGDVDDILWGTSAQSGKQAGVLGRMSALDVGHLIGTILDELERRDLRRGLVTVCAAGGMAPAVIIERI